MRFNSLLNPIGFPGKAQGDVPASVCVADTRMPETQAPSQGSIRASFSRYLPPPPPPDFSSPLTHPSSPSKPPSPVLPAQRRSLPDVRRGFFLSRPPPETVPPLSTGPAPSMPWRALRQRCRLPPGEAAGCAPKNRIGRAGGFPSVRVCTQPLSASEEE